MTTTARGPQARPTRTERRELWRRLRRLADEGDVAAIEALLTLTERK